MKKTIITCLTLFAISLCLFVSCSAENTAVNEINDVAYVTFGRDSRDFSASYEVKGYDTLYWFYTANKNDGYGTTGSTTGLTAVPAKTNGKGIGSGSVGPFSQGKWEFTLQAYANLSGNAPDTDTIVYKSDKIKVTLTGGETKAIPVTVSPVGENGTIKFQNAYFEYKNGGSEAPYFVINAVGEKATYILTNDNRIKEGNIIPITLAKSEGKFNLVFVGEGESTSDSIIVPVDYYACEAFSYLTDSSTPVASCTFGLKVYGNATTVVSGNLLENPDSKVSFDVAASDIKAFPGSELSSNIDVPVASVSGGKTTVNFSNASLETNATYAVNVEALTANAANEAFQISSSINEKEKEVLGSVKLSLTQIKDGNATTVSSFNGDVTVSTYIGKGLTGTISVVYNGTGDVPTDISYNAETGIVSFKTNHFSEFFIVRDGNVKNENQNKYYYSIQQAITNADTNNSLKLLKDITMTKDDSAIVYTVINNKVEEARYGLLLDKDVSIDLNGKTLTLYDRAYVNEKGNVTFLNGNIRSSNRGFIVEGGSLELNGINLTTEQKWGDAIFISEHSKNGTVAINNSEISAYDYAISTNASAPNVSENITVIINKSTIKAGEIAESRYEDATGLLFNVQGNVQINDSVISGTRQGVILRGGNTVISNSTISSGSFTDYKNNDGSNETDYRVNTWGTGNAVPLAALVIGNRTPNSYKYPTTVTLDEVTLKTGEQVVRKAMYVYQKDENYPVTVSGGLSKDSERTINVIDGDNKATVNVDKGIATVSNESTIVNSFSGLTDNSVVTLSHGLTTKLDSIDGKTIKFVGDDSQTIDMSEAAVACHNANLTFEHVNFKGSTGDYIGIQHVKTVTYNNCSFTAKRFLYGDTETFNNCNFSNEDGDYSVWTYTGEIVNFNNCDFYGDGKALLVYNEGKRKNVTINIKDCTFEGGSKEVGKAAIETDARFIKINLSITSSDFSKWVGVEENYSKSNIWGNKKNIGSDKLTVTIDGTKIQ